MAGGEDGPGAPGGERAAGEGGCDRRHRFSGKDTALCFHCLSQDTAFALRFHCRSSQRQRFSPRCAGAIVSDRGGEGPVRRICGGRHRAHQH